jgi:uncharacterized protein
MSTPDALLRLSAATLPALHRALGQGREPAEAARAARQFGFESGEAFHDALTDWVREDRGAALTELGAEEFWESIAGFFSTLGWGRLWHERLHEGVGSLHSRDWAEARPDSGARHPTCHVTTGMLAELLTRVAGTDLAVMEVECRSRGDEHCRFLLGSPAALSSLHETLAGGGSLEQALERL